MPNLINAIRAVPPKTRFYQVANAAVIAAAGRSLGIVHVMEYPKCGGSWIRNMIQQCLGGKPYSLNGLVGRRSVVQLHALYSRRHCKPVVVVRDPRDAFVSYYYHENTYYGSKDNLAIHRHFQRQLERDLRDDFAAYLDAKLTNRTFPPFSFRQFVDSWHGRPGSCLVRYEDFLKDAPGTLRKVLDFIGVAVEDEQIRQAVADQSFAKLTKQLYGVERQRGEGETDKFMRKAIAGDWKNHFNETSCRLFERYEGDTLRRLGYETETGWIERFLRASSQPRPIEAPVKQDGSAGTPNRDKLEKAW